MNFISLVFHLTLKLKKAISSAPLWDAKSETEVKRDTSETKFVNFFRLWLEQNKQNQERGRLVLPTEARKSSYGLKLTLSKPGICGKSNGRSQKGEG